MGPSIGLVSSCLQGVDSIYPGLNGGNSQEILLLVLRLIHVIRQSAQYIVNGWSRF